MLEKHLFTMLESQNGCFQNLFKNQAEISFAFCFFKMLGQT